MRQLRCRPAKMVSDEYTARGDISWIYPLTKDTERDRNEQTVAVPRCLEHLSVTCTGSCGLFLLDSCSYLNHLVIDQLGVCVITAVPLCQDLTCFFGTVHGNEPSWALWGHDETG
jgi:hypothetical protein